MITYETNNGTYCAAWPYTIDYNDSHLSTQIRLWCLKNFGDPKPDIMSHSDFLSSDYRYIDMVTWGEIEFKHKSDFNWFLLRWL